MSNPPIPSRLLSIDDLTRRDDYHLSEEDVCFHLWEYVKGGSFQDYPTNQLIKNLQIPSSECNNNYRWRYKTQAIAYAAKALGDVVPSNYLSAWTWIVMPPSAIRSDPAYDSRLTDLLNRVRPRISDVRELVSQRKNTSSKKKGITPEVRADNFLIDEEEATPEPQSVIVFDDVIAGGSHFKAIKMVLRERFPGVDVVGIFLARTLRPEEPTVEIDLGPLLGRFVRKR